MQLYKYFIKSVIFIARDIYIFLNIYFDFSLKLASMNENLTIRNNEQLKTNIDTFEFYNWSLVIFTISKY